MSSHLVDTLENLITLSGVGEMFVLHGVGELGKILVTVGTGSRGISEQSCNRESLLNCLEGEEKSMRRKTCRRFVIIFVASQLILGREHFSTEVTRKVLGFRMNIFNVSPQIILLNIFVAIRTFGHPTCRLVS